MSISKWRIVEYTSDGCGIEECLNCYARWEGRSGASGWKFCPHCGVQWEGRHECRQRDEKKWEERHHIWDRAEAIIREHPKVWMFEVSEDGGETWKEDYSKDFPRLSAIDARRWLEADREQSATDRQWKLDDIEQDFKDDGDEEFRQQQLEWLGPPKLHRCRVVPREQARNVRGW